MTAQHRDSLQDAILFGLCLWGYSQTQPLAVHGQIQWLAVMCAILAMILGFRLLHTALLSLSRFLDWLSIHTPTGKGGMARWGTYKKDLKGEIAKTGNAPYWCVAADKPNKALLIPFSSNAMSIAPARSGKGINTVIPTAMSNRGSKVILDYKGGELACTLKPALEARGETLRIINPYGLFTDTLGDTDRFNPLDTLVEHLITPNALRDIPSLMNELILKLYPEPNSGESDDTYWRDGGRGLIQMSIYIEILIDGFDADLHAIAMKLKDRQSFERDLRWILGIDLKGEPLEGGAMPIETMEWTQHHSEADVTEFAASIRVDAAEILELMTETDNKTYKSFAKGTQLKLARFAFGRLSPVLRHSTLRAGELKEENVTYIVMGDPSKPEDTGEFFSLFLWYAITEMKRHKNKGVPVHFIFDECTNYTIPDVANLMTYGGGFGILCHFILQALKAFEKRYGAEALEVLLSETEIKQILSGQRAPDTLKLISEMLGDQSIMSAALSLKQDTQGTTENMSESARPLATPEELRRTDDGILIVRKHLPVKINMVSYAEIDPWRDQVGINPYHGKPFLKKIKLRIPQEKGQ